MSICQPGFNPHEMVLTTKFLAVANVRESALAIAQKTYTNPIAI